MGQTYSSKATFETGLSRKNVLPVLPAKIVTTANDFWKKYEKTSTSQQKMQFNLLIYSMLFQSVKQSRKQLMIIDATSDKYSQFFLTQITSILDILQRYRKNEAKLLSELSVYIRLFQRYNIEETTLLEFWDRLGQELEQNCGGYLSIYGRYCIDVCAMYFLHALSHSNSSVSGINYQFTSVLLYDLLRLSFLQSSEICFNHIFGRNYLCKYVSSEIADIDICDFWMRYSAFKNHCLPNIDKLRCGLTLINQYLHPNNDNVLIQNNITNQSTINDVISGWKALRDRYHSVSNTIGDDSDGYDNFQTRFATTDIFEPIYNEIMQWLQTNHWKSITHIFS